jgi:hypothetical protein
MARIGALLRIVLEIPALLAGLMSGVCAMFGISLRIPTAVLAAGLTRLRSFFTVIGEIAGILILSHLSILMLFAEQERSPGAHRQIGTCAEMTRVNLIPGTAHFKSNYASIPGFNAANIITLSGRIRQYSATKTFRFMNKKTRITRNA